MPPATANNATAQAFPQFMSWSISAKKSIRYFYFEMSQLR